MVFARYTEVRLSLAVQTLGSARFRLCKKHMVRGSSPWCLPGIRKCGLLGCGMGYSSRGREPIYRFSHLGKQNQTVGWTGTVSVGRRGGSRAHISCFARPVCRGS